MSGAADEPGDRILRGGHLARVGGHAAVTSGTCDNPAAGASGSVGYSHDRRVLDLCFVRSARVIDRGSRRVSCSRARACSATLL